MWSCVNNHLVGYCSGEPDFDVQPIEKLLDGKDKDHPIHTGTFFGGHCKLSRETCGKYKTFTEVCPPTTTVTESKVSKTVKPVEKKTQPEQRPVQDSFL